VTAAEQLLEIHDAIRAACPEWADHVEIDGGRIVIDAPGPGVHVDVGLSRRLPGFRLGEIFVTGLIGGVSMFERYQCAWHAIVIVVRALGGDGGAADRIADCHLNVDTP
jgi:hypothetical protein